MRKNLTREERIGKKDISKVFEVSKSIKCSCIRLLYCRNGITINRIAVVLRKGYGNSVERNRAKRIIKELYREIKNGLPKGYDFIFFLNGSITDYHIAGSIIVSLFRQAGLMDVSGKSFK